MNSLHAGCFHSLLQFGVHVSHDLLGRVRTEGLENGRTGRGIPEPVHGESWLHRVRCLQLGSGHYPAEYAHRDDDAIVRQDRGQSHGC